LDHYQRASRLVLVVVRVGLSVFDVLQLLLERAVVMRGRDPPHTRFQNIEVVQCPVVERQLFVDPAPLVQTEDVDDALRVGSAGVGVAGVVLELARHV